MTDTTVTEKLSEAMREALRDASLKGEALKQFSDLAEKVEAQESMIEYLRKEKDKEKDLNRECQKDIERLEKTIEMWNGREEALETRERNTSEHEKDVAVAEAKTGVYYNVFNTIFKNAVVRRKTQEISAPNIGGEHGLTAHTSIEDLEATTEEE